MYASVIALVVQPGVEFNHDSVVDYDPARAVHLTELLKEEEGWFMKRTPRTTSGRAYRN